jgi:transposase-like protein
MKKRTRRCDPAREQQWQVAVRRWEQSGQSVRAYCRQEGLKESSFFFWRRELAQRDKQSGVRPSSPPRSDGQETSLPPKQARHAARFLPVQVVMGRSPEVASAIEIILDHGRMVRVPPQFDRQTLADVLAVLEARPC